MALCDFYICEHCRSRQIKMQTGHGRGESRRSVAKTPAFAGYHETHRRANCGSVHHTAYYFTEAKWESQEKIHKNIKNSTTDFDKA